jgi:cell division protein FtsN
MIRFTGVFLCALMMCSFSANTQQVKVFNNLPQSCRSSEQCIVEIVIEKSDIEGFARIQQLLPEGFSAELVSDAGSDFIFDKQRVSFIWLSLPAGETVKVSYKLSYGATMKGKFEIGEGAFSYLQENKLQKLALAPQAIWINMKPEVSEPTPVLKEEPEAVVQKPMQEQPVAEKQPVDESKPVQQEPKALELKPPKEQTPEAPTAVPAEVPVMQEPKALEPQVVKQEPQVAVPTSVNTEAKAPEPPAAKESQPPVNAEPKAPEPKPVAKEPAVQPVTPLPVSSSGITFRVQFAALKTQRDVESLRKQFNIAEQVFHEAADGWNRYTFGPFNSHTDAEAARKAYVAKNGGNAIVVRYQDGKRAQ